MNKIQTIPFHDVHLTVQITQKHLVLGPLQIPRATSSYKHKQMKNNSKWYELMTTLISTLWTFYLYCKYLTNKQIFLNMVKQDINKQIVLCGA
jgi:hypothetical protein